MSERVEAAARAVETIILRRLHAKKAEGYTLEMSRELAQAALAAADATPSDVAGLCWRLRETLEAMANRCSVDQILWNEHSNAVLEAAVEIARLAADNARLEREIGSLGDRLNVVQAEREAAEARVAELEGLIAFAESCEPPRG